jgi:hypothetical protein
MTIRPHYVYVNNKIVPCPYNLEGHKHCKGLYPNNKKIKNLKRSVYEKNFKGYINQVLDKVDLFQKQYGIQIKTGHRVSPKISNAMFAKVMSYVDNIGTQRPIIKSLNFAGYLVA